MRIERDIYNFANYYVTQYYISIMLLIIGLIFGSIGFLINYINIFI